MSLTDKSPQDRRSVKDSAASFVPLSGGFLAKHAATQALAFAFVFGEIILSTI
jgi:hypothetical protein